jgi:response regulator RpfG family c-di-GMP phosphodiesterase/PAS domain-containing protein
MTQTPAPKILLFEETPDKNLHHRLQALGYSVQIREFPDAAIFNYVAQSQPELLLALVSLPISQTLVDTVKALRARFGMPVIYLVAPAAESLMTRNGIQNYLCWPASTDQISARLARELQNAAPHPQAPAQPGGNGQQDWIFQNTAVPLLLEDFSGVYAELRKLEQRGIHDLRAYFTENPREVERCFESMRILDANEAARKLFHAPNTESMLVNCCNVLDPLAHSLLLEELVALGEGRTEFSGEGINADLDGNLLHVRLSWSAPVGQHNHENLSFIVSIVDMTELRHKQDTLQLIALVSAALRNAKDRAEMLNLVVSQITRYLNIHSVALFLARPEDRDFVIERASGEWLAASGRSLPKSSITRATITSSDHPYTHPDIRRESHFPLADLVKKDVAFLALPLQTQQTTIGQLWVGAKTPFAQLDIELLSTLADIVANAIHRATLYEHSQQYAEQIATASAIGRALSTTLEIQAVYEQLAQGVLQLLPDIAGIYISTYDNQNRLVSYVYGQQDGALLDLKQVKPIPLDSPSAGSQSEVIRTRQPLITNDLQARRRQMRTAVLFNAPASNAQSGIYVPMLAKDEILGVLYVQSYVVDRFTASDGELLALVANTGAIALQNARLFAATQRRVQRLTALHAIDVAISSSLDLRVTLNTLLDQLLALVRVDAANILILEPTAQVLEYASGRGFRSAAVSQSRLSLGEGLAGRAALENHIVCSENLSPQDDPRADGFHAEAFVTYSAAPLLVKGQVKGVLEVFSRSPMEIDMEWQEFLETLAGQVAVAIDNATLVSQLQRTNQELTLAYDTTLMGWTRALYLRDRETESHTRRVTEYSVQLARAMGLSESDLVHVRRGALLHDIGKLGIPDNILLKTGPLNESEWSKMQLHPGYANDMLKDIQFLGPARLIPYCHHERWDGSGYPRGLKGEQIPLTARIFSVADVWDSLLSDRPYRPAWPREKARDYIISHAGTYFDPQVVEVFLRILA